jgi:cellulose synthase operon protein C
MRDSTGAIRGWFHPMRPNAATDALSVTRLVSAEVRDALRGCPEIEVLARPPTQGLPELLPIEFAWSFRVDAGPTQTHPLASGPAALPARRMVIANVEPPAALRIARLSPWRSAEPPQVLLEGKAATPSRALAEMGEATFVEIHAHGKVEASGTDASFVMLSPDPDGRYALTAAAIRQRPLHGRPTVILAACEAARLATHRHEAWSLPASFIAAGARAVIASSAGIGDAGAGELFDDVRARIQRGSSPAVALRDARTTYLANHPTATWVRAVMVFQ